MRDNNNKPVATLYLTSSSTDVDTTDLVITSTFSTPINTTRYGNISLFVLSKHVLVWMSHYLFTVYKNQYFYSNATYLYILYIKTTLFSSLIYRNKI